MVALLGGLLLAFVALPLTVVGFGEGIVDGQVVGSTILGLFALGMAARGALRMWKLRLQNRRQRDDQD